LAVAVAVAEAVAEVEVEVEVEEEAVEESPQEAVEPQQAHPLSQENWEATHQKNSTETGRKANPSSSTSSYTEE